jgi:hypothetical protein
VSVAVDYNVLYAKNGVAIRTDDTATGYFLDEIHYLHRLGNGVTGFIYEF